MTSVLVFIKPGMPGQLSSGAMITFSFLILALNYRPFCTSTLNSLNSITLVAQFCTLFVGLMIALLDANPAQGGAEDRRDRAIITVMVMLINGAALVWPILIKILSGTLSGYFMLFLGFYQGCSLYVRWCGRQHQSARVAASMADYEKFNTRVVDEEASSSTTRLWNRIENERRVRAAHVLFLLQGEAGVRAGAHATSDQQKQAANQAWIAEIKQPDASASTRTPADIGSGKPRNDDSALPAAEGMVENCTPVRNAASLGQSAVYETVPRSDPPTNTRCPQAHVLTYQTARAYASERYAFAGPRK